MKKAINALLCRIKHAWGPWHDGFTGTSWRRCTRCGFYEATARK